jgi:hypothetical protein
MEAVDAPNSREHKLVGADSRVHLLRLFIARDRPLWGVLVFEVKPTLIVCDNVVKMGSPYKMYPVEQQPSGDVFDRRPKPQYASIPNVFQMKSMKVNCKMKSMLNKGFEHNEELWSIWEKNNI